MKVKLALTTVDTDKIKYLHCKYKKLHIGLNGTERPHYSIEFNDGNFMAISKQEYKLLLKYLQSKGE